MRNLDLNWLRSQFGTVAQEADLFSGSIADNIRLGNLNATSSEVEEAAQSACAHGFIEMQPEVSWPDC